MKLSDFRQKQYSKQLQYIDGVPTLVEHDKLDGNINFYSLDESTISKIGQELISDKTLEEKDELFMYKLLPYLCDIEVDITLDEFSELMSSTNKNFIKFIEIIIALINDTISMADSIEHIQSASTNIREKTNIVVETDEDKLDRLYEELDNASNRNEKRRLLKDISKLEEKMSLNA